MQWQCVRSGDSMLYLVLATTVLSVDARELKFYTGNDAISKCSDFSAFDCSPSSGTLKVLENPKPTIQDPWSPIVGDTEGAQAVTPHLRDGSDRRELLGVPGRRAQSLVESLRRQLMRDNYDYINKESGEHKNTTVASTTTKTTLTTTVTSTVTTTKASTTKLTTVDIAGMVELPFITSPYYNPGMDKRGSEAIVRSQPQMQVASVNLPMFPVNGPFDPAPPHQVYPAYPPGSLRSPASGGQRPPVGQRPISAHPQTARPAVATSSVLPYPSVHRFRSFNEAYNTPSPLEAQGGRTETKREVYKKDLLYYVDDDRLNNQNTLHLRRNNDLTNEAAQTPDQGDHYEENKWEHISAQSDFDTTTANDASQQRQDEANPDEDFRRHGHELPRRYRKRRNKHRFPKYNTNNYDLKGINKRAKLYGLMTKRKTPKMTYNRRQNEGRRKNNLTNHHGSQEHNMSDVNGNVEEVQKDHHGDENDDKLDNHYDMQYGELESNQAKENTGMQLKTNTTDGRKKSPQGRDLIQEEEQIIDDSLSDQREYDKQHSEGQENENGRRNFQPYQYLEETTSNVKYKLLKVESLGGSRRSGMSGSRHILQERGSKGVALISLDKAPFPQFQLPRARRQYMQEYGHGRNPLVEQLPKVTSISRRNYGGRRVVTYKS